MSRLLACALLLLVAAPAAADRWERTVEVTGRPLLVVRSQDASVAVSGWDRPAIGIRVATHGWAIGPHGVQVDVARSGNRIVLQVREPHPRISFTFHGPREIRVEVDLPREADLDLTSGDGPVEIGSVSGALVVRCADGGITATDLKGDLRFATGDGRIEGHGLDGRLVAETNDGRVQVDGRFDHLEVRTGDGRVVATARPGSRMADGWTLRSADGSLTLNVPPDLRSDLLLRSGGGGIHLDLPVETYGEKGRHLLQGRLNGGGPMLEMHTSDGPIWLGAS